MLEFSSWASHCSRRASHMCLCAVSCLSWECRFGRHRLLSLPGTVCRASQGKVHGGDGLLVAFRGRDVSRERLTAEFLSNLQEFGMLVLLCLPVPVLNVCETEKYSALNTLCLICLLQIKVKTGFHWSLCMTWFIGWNRYFHTESHLS